MFSRLYISTQSRGADLDSFFSHENHAWPPALANHNIMHQGNKADPLDCLEQIVTRPSDCPLVNGKIFDGAALVHSLDPKDSTKEMKTFDDYAKQVVIPYLTKHLRSVERVDVVWDIYKSDSLKSQTRAARGSDTPIRFMFQTQHKYQLTGKAF